MVPLDNASSHPSRLLILMPFLDYEFFEPLRRGARDAAKALAVHVIFDGVVDGDVSLLAEKAMMSLTGGFAGLAVIMTKPRAFADVAREAAKRHLPLISLNVDDPSVPRLASIGQDMFAAGKLFGSEIRNYLTGSEHRHILLTMHDAGVSALEQRCAGIQEALSTSDITWTKIITGTDSMAAVDRIRDALTSNAKISAVFSTGMADTEAAGLALKAHFPGRPCIVAGFDTNPQIIRLVNDGYLKFTVDQQPYAQGFFAVVSLTLAARQGVLPANIDTRAVIVQASG